MFLISSSTMEQCVIERVRVLFLVLYKFVRKEAGDVIHIPVDGIRLIVVGGNSPRNVGIHQQMAEKKMTYCLA